MVFGGRQVAPGMYELVDFGLGRKLERIGGRLIDRPCPAAAEMSCSHPKWQKVDATFQLSRGHRGTWSLSRPWEDGWTFETEFGKLELGLSPFGHIGVFPEQSDNWHWIASHAGLIRGTRLLNLFAYSGGSTLAAAAAGAEVTHVDSAANIVARARSNAVRSGLNDRPIRWIVEDALRFVVREARRGNRYDGVILDPPTYGHGVSRRQVWNLDEGLPQLLDALRVVVADCRMIVCTCHSPGMSARVLKSFVSARFAGARLAECGDMNLPCPDGRRLDCGVFVRWAAD
jgi:23S rRNA (cytosine1962-C5)-methyltransferase